MTISSSVRKAGPYTGNGVATSFAFSFKVFTESDLQVVRLTSGVETELVLNSDYSVTLNADQNASPGGSITYPISGTPLSASETLTIGGSIEALQPAALSSTGGFYPRVIEDALDRAVILAQQFLEKATRSIRGPLSDSIDMELPVAASRANLYLGFDSGGQPIMLPGTVVFNEADAANVGFVAAGAGAVPRSMQSKGRDEVHIFDYMNDADIAAARAGTLTNATAAFNTAVAAVRRGGTLRVEGKLPVDPITINKEINIIGHTSRQTAWVAAAICARGNQTHILMFKGGAGVFPTDQLSGIDLNRVTLYGQNYTISDAALVLWNAAMGNSIGLNITNVVGRAIRFNDAMDFHFVQPHIADCGDNVNQKSVIYCDPASSNNCNNLYFVDPHFESLGWTILESTAGDDDQIQLIGGKSESRVEYAGQTATNLTFNLFKITSNRFTCNHLTLTNIHIYSGETFLINGGFANAVSGCKVFNTSAQTGTFVSVTGTASGYTVRDNTGYNIGVNQNTASKHGYFEDTWWSNNNNKTNRRAILDAVSPPIDRLVSNAGGNFVYGISGSLTGKSFTFAVISDPEAGVLVPIGHQSSIKVRFRLYSDLGGRTVSLGYRTAAGAYTAVRTGVAVSNPGFGYVDVVLTPAMLATAIEAVVVKEQGDNNLYVDGAWLEYSDGDTSGSAGLLVPAALTNIGIASSVSFFKFRHTYGASALVCADINHGATIIYQAGGLFVAGAPAANQIQFSVTGGGQLQGLSGGLAGTGVWFTQEVVF